MKVSQRGLVEMNLDAQYKYVIIGNSAAGIGCVEGIRKVDKEGSIAVISEEKMHTYSRCLTSYYIAGVVDDEKILFRPKDYYAKKNVTPILGKKVVKILPEDNHIVLDDGTRIGYSSLMIATGASPVIYDIPGNNKPGVFVLRTYEDARRISEAAAPGKRAVVMGGGLVGLKAADALHAKGVEVWVIVTSPQIMSQTMDRDGAEILRKQLEENGIKVMTETNVEEIIGDKKVEAVRLSTGQTLTCDIVIFAKGVRPNIGLAKDAGIDTDYGILVDTHMRTSVPNIYAAGDVAEAKDFITGERYIHAIWPNAVEQGCIAGQNMAGRDVEYAGGIAMNSVDLFGLASIAVGFTRPRGKDHGYEIISRLIPEKKFYRKIVLKDGVIVGAICIGEVEAAGVFAGLIKRRANVSKIKELLLREDFDYAKVLGEGLIKDTSYFATA
jgi:NAD(P)H-nitrite reductase large subunit